MPDATLLDTAAISGGGVTPPGHGNAIVLAGGPAPDLTPPTVTLVSPAMGPGRIQPSTPIVFDVTDSSGSVGRIFVFATTRLGGPKELVHDGSAFEPEYAANSVRSAISNGFRYSVLRFGGWPTSHVQIRTWPIDAVGNEA
jgi:hypothetical protein